MYFDRNAMNMLRKMGLKVEEIQAKRVIIETENGKIVFEAPQVVKTSLQGQEAYQVIGKPEVVEEINEEDVQLVMEKTGATREEAEKALKETGGDIVEAIMKLTG